MGQTLTNGIYLPDEGERNCYTGLAANWRALDYLIGGYNVHVADAVIHVSQADRDKWDAVDNKADSSALTAHTGDTTIHVTAEDKNKWDAVTSKANDSDVVHKSGNETISGNKTFSSINGVEPSSLSLPSSSGTIDISSYITDLTGVKVSSYIPLANGYIVITCNSNNVDYIKMSNNLDFVSVVDNTNNQFTSGILGVWQPCIAGVGIQIRIKSSALRTARFIPCQGNV